MLRQSNSSDMSQDLAGKSAVVTGASASSVAVVTGANEGIGFKSAYNLFQPSHKNTSLGYETALALAQRGCKVIMACRNLATANESRQDILKKVPHADIIVEHLDLTDFSSIRHFVRHLTENHGISRLSLLVNNAGINAIPYSVTKDGNETIFQTNYLGHFLLTKELFPLLKADDSARIISVTSFYHHNGIIDLKNFNDKAQYTYEKAYANSKLAQLMFAFELQRRIEAEQLSMMSIAVHPGSAKTTMLYKTETQDCNHTWTRFLESVFGQSPADGARPAIYASTAKDAEGGTLYGPCFLEVFGSAKKVDPDEKANNIETARELWEKSEKLIGEPFEVGVTPRPSFKMAI